MTASDYIISAIDSKAKEGVIEEYKQFDWSASLINSTLAFKPTRSQ